jgi:hypothetical protein
MGNPDSCSALGLPVATSYPHIDQIERVGGPWTLDLGGLGGLGIANEDICMFGGAHVVVSYAHSSGARGPLGGSGVLYSLV